MNLSVDKEAVFTSLNFPFFFFPSLFCLLSSLFFSSVQNEKQLATFHPRYRFEGSNENDASNYTNRSPYPILHLLLEQQVSISYHREAMRCFDWLKNITYVIVIGLY